MNNKKKLTLDSPAIYEITVPGMLDKKNLDWFTGVTLTIKSDDDGLVNSTLSCTVDQAALQGLLRQLYSLGLPLISVLFVEADQQD